MKKNSESSDRVTLDRYFSKRGLGSRADARAWIDAGLVRVNGEVCRDGGTWVSLSSDRVERAGAVALPESFRALLFHKPKGVVTTRHDERDRPTLFALLPPELGYLHAAGRLDQATSGLIVLTNSTVLSAYLTEPVNAIPRVYLATVRGEWEDSATARVLAGVVDEGETLRALACICRKRSGRESHLVLTLVQGKNREIRRLTAALGHPVTKLKRVEFGPFKLGEIAPGKFRELSRDEVARAFPELRAKLIKD